MTARVPITDRGIRLGRLIQRVIDRRKAGGSFRLDRLLRLTEAASKETKATLAAVRP